MIRPTYLLARIPSGAGLVIWVVQGALAACPQRIRSLASRLSYLVLTSCLLNLGVGAWLHKSAVSCAGWPFWVRGGVPGFPWIPSQGYVGFPLGGLRPLL